MEIKATNVTKTYGSVTALDGLSLSISSGSTVGLLGTNGAGKTTLFRLLIGHTQPDAGTVQIGETTVSAAGPTIRQHVGYLPERVGFPPELTAREVLRVTGRVRTLPELDERVSVVLEQVGLEDDADRPVGGFSNGMRRRLGLATALVADPDVLLLDEPTAGLDPLGVVAFHRIVKRVSERTDATVVICSHALAEVERLCEHVAILDDGQLLAAESLAELTAGATTTRQLRIHCEDRERRNQALSVCRPFAEPQVRGATVTATVSSEETLELMTRLAETVGLDGVELHTPGLAERFESIVTQDDPTAGLETKVEVP